ncbi:MAG: ABC transporter permease [Candidatus Krumholzibacteria bacterium]|nr:ABC transporter permease [Candidatus Krumholzibacteria bacterium]
MRAYVARRLARTLPLVILISIVTFALLHLAPGGPVGLYADDARMSESDLARIRTNLGLDEPLPVQYMLWFKRAFLGFDFGASYATGQPVSQMIMDRLPATLELMGTAFVLAVVLGISIGIASALRRGRFLDQLFSVISAFGLSMPVFWLGIIAIYVFSLKLGLFPSGGRVTLGAPSGFMDHARHLVLPASVLSVGFLASWSSYTRSQFIGAIQRDFVRTARAKGLSESAVIWKHALRNAALPILTAIVIQIPTLFTGAVITETVFSWPGMGRLFYEGLERHDYPRVLGVVVIFSFLIILFNLLGDFLCAAIDPRISLAGATSVGSGREEEL